MKKHQLIVVLCLMSIGQMFGQFNITFELNTELMPSIDPTGIYLAGGSGFGVPGDNQMTDTDGDGIYTITLEREEGFSSNYTFLNGNCGDWSCKEDIAGLPCGDPANFNDRFFPELTSDITIQACFGNCANDGSCEMNLDSIAITFELNTALIDVSPEGVFIAGGGAFGNPGDNPLLDLDGDGIYTTTIMKPTGFSSFYTYTNGACGDYSCKENIAGLPCADAANFNDRFLPVVNENTTIKACFGTCEDTGNCTIVTDSIEITFELNTSTIDVDPAGIFIAGGNNFGFPGDNPMIDPDGDGIYTFTTTRQVGFASYYTFLNGNCPDWACKEDISGLPCADENAFNDRYLEPVMENTTIKACFGNCEDDGSCIPLSTTSLTIDASLFDVLPTIAHDYIEIRFGQPAIGMEKQIVITSLSGNRVYSYTEKSDVAHRVNTIAFATGVYFVSVQTEGTVFTKQFIVQ